MARAADQTCDLATVELLRTRSGGDAGDNLRSKRLHVAQLEDCRTREAKRSQRPCAAEAQHDHDRDLRIADQPEKSTARPENPQDPIKMRDRQLKQLPVADEDTVGNRKSHQHRECDEQRDMPSQISSEPACLGRQHKELRGVFLIQDGGASHIAGDTRKYFAGSQGWWRPRYTPANASWLNQAEILIHAFKHYYLKRASWKSQQEFKAHVMASWPEYNHRYAHPFEWTWTNQKMRQWFATHTSNSLQIL